MGSQKTFINTESFIEENRELLVYYHFEIINVFLEIRKKHIQEFGETFKILQINSKISLLSLCKISFKRIILVQN